MDPVTQSLKDMYEQYPYPSSETGTAKYRELRNLLQIFAMETRLDFAEKSILDIGTGTGHRLVEAARAFPRSRFTGIDISEGALNIARQHEGAEHVQFRQANLLEDLSSLGTFDIVLCMGVLHHLPSPREGLLRLVERLDEHGILFLYVYGRRGGRERMRRKEVVNTLRAGDTDLQGGIQLVRDLQFDTFEYGWNIESEDASTRDGLVVDAYLNVNETLYTSDELLTLFEGTGLSGFAIYGITTAQAGYLFDTAIGAKSRMGIPRTDPVKFLPTERARIAYERLPLREKVKFLDLVYEPNGYTLVACKGGSVFDRVGGERLARNWLSSTVLSHQG